ncbi:GntR family transcriptional regulator [Kineococcus sp. R8]|uniref:GntR family transcriptional regulator n=1 Tax=Kineococcus siccus TaxID=2696567 RepID=UPI001412D35A|nr:GntR family transcriptional regulator [Kineococcus siccus]NAZ82276.1 GntR family transcriptional regulator [Kineococcus siccus]
MGRLVVDASSATPPYEQLKGRIVAGVRSGELPAGSRLPTVRSLADDLGIAPNTVARAYRELEADGFIETRGRNGSFVAPQGDATQRLAQEAASAYAARVRQLGVPAGDAVRYVAAALQG